MARLLIHIEGETEETFVNEILAPHLRQRGFKNVSARLLGNSRLRQRRGGIRSWPSVRSDIIKHLREDPGSIATTMVDYYALPQTGDKAWPGRKEATKLLFAQKASTVEKNLKSDLLSTIGQDFNPNRFIPFVIMHEFEGLLFSDCEAFSRSICHPDLKNKFQSIRNQFSSPEEINDSPNTAPSKRILDLVPGYEKPLFGNIAILEIGLQTIRNQCPLFNNWLNRLENIDQLL